MAILFKGKERRKPAQVQEEKSLYPVLRVAESLKDYQKELAEKESCVIVGRCADYILQGREDCFHVFITGALPDRANRVIAEHGVAVDAARSHVKERDRKRSSYYRHITDQAWGMATNYDLCLNSSKLGIDRCVDLILGAVDMGTGHI